MMHTNSNASQARLALHHAGGEIDHASLITRLIARGLPEKIARDSVAVLKIYKEVTYRVAHGRADPTVPVKFTAKGIEQTQKLLAQLATAPEPKAAKPKRKPKRKLRRTPEPEPEVVPVPVPTNGRGRAHVSSDIGYPPEGVGMLLVGDRIASFIDGKRRDFTRDEFSKLADFFSVFHARR
jgi:hypothetical protein